MDQPPTRDSTLMEPHPPMWGGLHRSLYPKVQLPRGGSPLCKYMQGGRLSHNPRCSWVRRSTRSRLGPAGTRPSRIISVASWVCAGGTAFIVAFEGDASTQIDLIRGMLPPRPLLPVGVYSTPRFTTQKPLSHRPDVDNSVRRLGWRSFGLKWQWKTYQPPSWWTIRLQLGTNANGLPTFALDALVLLSTAMQCSPLLCNWSN